MKKIPVKHSKIYSPSKSSIWMNCPLSTFYNDGSIKEEVNPLAEFGTQCHELGAALISKSLNLTDYDDEFKSIEEVINDLDMYSDDMQSIADGYADYIINLVEFEKKQSDSDQFVVIEQELDMDFDEDARGTLDCGIISSVNGGTLTVADLKTGRTPVYALDKETGMFNSQLGIYALYFYKVYKDIYPVKKVRLIVYQPVINNTNEYEMDIDDLLRFETEVLRPAVERTKDDYRVGVTGKHCRYCPGRYICMKRGDENMETMKKLEKPISSMSDEQIEELLPKLDEFIRWAEDVKSLAIKRAEKGHEWSGFKLVHSRVTRKITNEEAVIKKLKEAGIDPFVKQKLAGITELTKRVGKDKFKSLLGEYVSTKVGSVALVPISDSREEITLIRGEK